MIRTTLTAAAIAIGSVVAQVQAKTTEAYCMVSVHNDSIPVSPLRACHFAQCQGNAYVRLADGINYAFPEK